MVHTESLYLQVYERLSEFGLRFSHSNPLSALTFFYQFTPQIFADSKSVSRSFDLQKIGSVISQTIREQDNKKIIVGAAGAAHFASASRMTPASIQTTPKILCAVIFSFRADAPMKSASSIEISRVGAT